MAAQTTLKDDHLVSNAALYNAIEKLTHQVKELSDNVKSIHTQLSQMQESIAFAQDTAIEAKHETIEANKRIDELEKQVHDQQHVITNLSTICRRLTESNIHQEAYSRRDNLLFDGLQDQGKDENCTKIILNLLKDKMDFTEDQIKDIRIVRCHRLGPVPKTPRKRPRTIICKFHWFGDRQAVFSRGSKLKGSTIRMSEDYPREIVYRRNILAPIMFAARNLQKNAHMSVDKLVIDGITYTISDLEKLPAELSPSKVGVSQITNNISGFFGAVSPLSNFFPAPFTDHRNGTAYHSSEQFLQHHKALLFEDEVTAAAIMAAPTPGECKALGRKVANFNPAKWRQDAKQIMTYGLKAKFDQNPLCSLTLKSTKNSKLVEASPYDSLWGVGLALKNQDLANPDLWKGNNLMGTLLEDLRKTITEN